MSGIDLVLAQAHTLLISTRSADQTPAVALVRAALNTKADVAMCVDSSELPRVLARLARCAQAGDPHALLMAAVLVRDQLRVIAAHLGGDSEDAAADTLAAFFTLLRTTAEPQTLTERSLAAQVLRCLYAAASGPQEAVLHEPDAAVFDQPEPDHPDPRARAARLLEHAHTQGVITALEHTP